MKLVCLIQTPLCWESSRVGDLWGRRPCHVSQGNDYISDGRNIESYLEIGKTYQAIGLGQVFCRQTQNFLCQKGDRKTGIAVFLVSTDLYPGSDPCHLNPYLQVYYRGNDPGSYLAGA